MWHRGTFQSQMLCCRLGLSYSDQNSPSHVNPSLILSSAPSSTSPERAKVSDQKSSWIQSLWGALCPSPWLGKDAGATPETAALLIQASPARSWRSTAPAEMRARRFSQRIPGSSPRLKGKSPLGLWACGGAYILSSWGLGGGLASGAALRWPRWALFCIFEAAVPGQKAEGRWGDLPSVST